MMEGGTEASGEAALPEKGLAAQIIGGCGAGEQDGRGADSPGHMPAPLAL